MKDVWLPQLASKFVLQQKTQII